MDAQYKTDHQKEIAAREADARGEIARHELACAMARLFVPRIQQRKRTWLEETARYMGATVTLRGPELDACDLGVLLAIQVIGERSVTDRDTSAAHEMLPAAGGDDSEMPNAAAEKTSLRVRTTIAEIARLTGMGTRDGRACKRIRDAIAHLMGFVITVEGGAAGEKWAATQMIHKAGDDRGALTLDLNYLATRAALGIGQWATVSMRQWRDCSTPVERVLLHRLAVLTTGKLVSAKLDTLAAGCWTDEPRNDHSRRKRRQQVRNAIAAGRCVPVGVAASVDGRGLVTFKRTQPHP